MYYNLIFRSEDGLLSATHKNNGINNSTKESKQIKGIVCQIVIHQTMISFATDTSTITTILTLFLTFCERDSGDVATFRKSSSSSKL